MLLKPVLDRRIKDSCYPHHKRIRLGTKILKTFSAGALCLVMGISGCYHEKVEEEENYRVPGVLRTTLQIRGFVCSDVLPEDWSLVEQPPASRVLPFEFCADQFAWARIEVVDHGIYGINHYPPTCDIPVTILSEDLEPIARITQEMPRIEIELLEGIYYVVAEPAAPPEAFEDLFALHFGTRQFL